MLLKYIIANGSKHEMVNMGTAVTPNTDSEVLELTHYLAQYQTFLPVSCYDAVRHSLGSDMFLSSQFKARINKSRLFSAVTYIDTRV